MRALGLVAVLLLVGCSTATEAGPRELDRPSPSVTTTTVATTTTTTTTTSPPTTTTTVPTTLATTTTTEADVRATSAEPTWALPLAACESTYDTDGQPPHRINWTIVSRNGRYHGGFQFSIPTWQSVGGTGSPAQASPQEQIDRATILRELEDPYQQWPTCWPLLFGPRR